MWQHVLLKSSGLNMKGVAGAFTLVEMLAVMAVIVVIIALSGPAMNALRGAGDVNKAVYDIAGIIQQASAYAKANDTYVYLGIEEVDVGQPAGTTPQASGIGRVAMALIAAKDGTRGYQMSDLSAGLNLATFQAGMNAVGTVQVFENLHLVDFNDPPPSGNMARPPLKIDPITNFKYNLGDSNCTSVTPFAYPLGATAASARFFFQKVLQFDPRGVVRIQTATNSDTITPLMEIDFQQTHGTVAAALNSPVASGNVAAIQIDGVTGAVRVFRP